MIDFVHLHVHSDFSLLDGAVSVMGLADKAEKLGMSHLALTDHGNMFGAMEFLAACEETVNESGQHEKRKNPVKPIIGCEVYVSPGSRFEKKGSENENRYYHLVLLAANRKGYLNLVKLCSFAYTEGFYYRPRIDEELLAEYHEGLIALSACVSGEIPRLIQAGKGAEAELKARHYRDLFGSDENGNPNFYLEIQDHGIPAEALRGPLSQKDINTEIAGIARRTGIPLVATNDVHYLNREDSIAHDVLLCIGTAQTRGEERRKKKYYGDQYYLKSGDEMAALFPEYPEAILNTRRIADRCKADTPAVTVKELPKYLPDFEIPEGFESAGDYLRRLAADGLASRYPKEKAEAGDKWKDIQHRLEYELGIIIQMGFSGYFLIVADFIRWAKEHDIPVGPGRGSGAGSITAYVLRITDIDPLKYGLLFERFLNPERISMPDFDVDFANEGREQVINYVTEKYGREQVGQIITFGTLGAKAVIKDVARVLGISIPESDMITKLIPRDPKITLLKAVKGEPRLEELVQNPRYTELFSLAGKLEGLKRHSSIHASGVVIGRLVLHDLVPLYRDPKTGAVATQYEWEHLEKCGLVKMDFLGLKTLDVIKNTEDLIRRRGGQFADFRVKDMPENDEAVFKMLGEGMSFEVFQFESDGMQDVLKRAKPGKIEDLIALNALYRPGPMANIPRFVDSKNGRQKISYPDPSLEPVLRETYGVIVYQEQVLQVARIIAGYSLGQADLLRKAMGKKIKEILDKEKIPFVEGAVKKGYSREKADEIFELLIPFAGYGFNKSHSAGYAVLAYHTAYLKVNFPAEFMAANLSNEINSADKDKLSECIAEARKMGLPIDPPDINRSQKLFDVVDGRIVYGLMGIKGLGDASAEEVVKCRRDPATGKLTAYRDFMDFLARIDIKTAGKGVIEKLIQTGAFDKLGTKREILLGNLERAVEYAQNIKDDRKFGQVSLFGETGEKEYPDFIFENFPETVKEDKFKTEKELIGFYFSGHPMDEYRELWEKAVKADLGHPETLLQGQRASGSQILLGLIKNIKPITTNRGDKMAFASLEDYNGEIELTFFSSVWDKCRDKIENGKVAILNGKIDYQADRDKYSFTVNECLEAADIERALKEDEERIRKWDRYRNVWKYAGDLDLLFPDLGDTPKIEPGIYTIIGAIKSLRLHVDNKKREMAFGTIQDNNGEIDLVFFSRAWENCKALVAEGETLALKGTIDPRKDKNPLKPSFVVSSVLDLNRLVRAAAKRADAGSAEGGFADTSLSGAGLAENGPSGEGTEVASAVAGAGAGAVAGSGSGSLAGASAGAKAASKKFAASSSGSKKAPCREIHIRLAAEAAGNENSLCSLLNFFEGNPGDCPLYIHVPGQNGVSKETVILASSRVSSSVTESLGAMPAVADVWRRGV